MAVDLYLKIPTDPNFDPKEIEAEDGFQLLLQQIELILTSRKGEVLGDPDFGANLEDYLWSNYSSGKIESEINSQISKYCSNLTYQYPYKIEVNFVKGDVVDTIIVDIFIDGTKALGIAVT